MRWAGATANCKVIGRLDIYGNNNNNNNNNRIFIQDNPSVQSTVINGVLFHKDKDQTITPGTPRPTLCDKCVGSLTSHRVMNIEVL